MSDVVVINKVAEEWGSLGNMSRHSVVYASVVWPRSEHLFQALRLTCLELREEIRAISNPMAAKMRAKKLMRENPDKVAGLLLGDEDLSRMTLVLELKLKQHKDVRELLARTGTRHIVEDATRRQRGSGLFWGAALQDDGSWKGDNALGELWMLIRKKPA